MLTVSGLLIYPVKSLGGISLSFARLSDRGFEYDRRWMLVDEDNVFLSQRTLPEMALLSASINETHLEITHKKNPGLSLSIPLEYPEVDIINVRIWDDICTASVAHGKINEWFSSVLNISCRLVYMPDHSQRKVEQQYAKNGEITSFSDAYPLLMIGQASLDDLNNRLAVPVPMNRFRPNIVFTGGYPYQEDEMPAFKINGISFEGVKPCARCTIPTVNQEDAITSKEPLKTLATYRTRNNKVYFGQNLLPGSLGKIKVGDEIVWK